MTLGHKMKNDILNGVSPSEVFRNLIFEDPSLTNSDLSNLLRNEFVRLDSHAAALVWHWKRPGKLQGLSDENLNGHLMKYLKEAKYL